MNGTLVTRTFYHFGSVPSTGCSVQRVILFSRLSGCCSGKSSDAGTKCYLVKIYVEHLACGAMLQAQFTPFPGKS